MSENVIFDKDFVRLPWEEIPSYLELIRSYPKPTQAVIYLMLDRLSEGWGRRFPINKQTDYSHDIESLTLIITHNPDDKELLDDALLVANGDLRLTMAAYLKWVHKLNPDKPASKSQGDKLMGYAVMFDALKEILAYVGKESEKEITAMLEDLRLEQSNDPSCKYLLTAASGAIMFKILRKLQRSI